MYDLRNVPDCPDKMVLDRTDKIKRKTKWGWLKTLFMSLFFNKKYEKCKKLNSIFEGRGKYYDRLFLGDIFSAYEYADSDDVEKNSEGVRARWI